MATQVPDGTLLGDLVQALRGAGALLAGQAAEIADAIHLPVALGLVAVLVWRLRRPRPDAGPLQLLTALMPTPTSRRRPGTIAGRRSRLLHGAVNFTRPGDANRF